MSAIAGHAKPRGLGFKTWTLNPNPAKRVTYLYEEGVVVPGLVVDRLATKLPHVSLAS
jgi:hypothetical protein